MKLFNGYKDFNGSSSFIEETMVHLGHKIGSVPPKKEALVPTILR
jgi:hypothetical protein